MSITENNIQAPLSIPDFALDDWYQEHDHCALVAKLFLEYAQTVGIEELPHHEGGSAWFAHADKNSDCTYYFECDIYPDGDLRVAVWMNGCTWYEPGDSCCRDTELFKDAECVFAQAAIDEALEKER